jgi:FkbH-like protein
LKASTKSPAKSSYYSFEAANLEGTDLPENDSRNQLWWLPHNLDWQRTVESAQRSDPQSALEQFIALANSRIDFIQTARLDRAIQRAETWLRGLVNAAKPIRLALLGSCTLTHLSPGIRIGAMRRGVWVDVYEGGYGMYRQEIQDKQSELYQFRPDVLLLSIDAYHLVGTKDATVADALQGLRDCWRMARDNLGCAVIQQTVLPVFPPLMGNNEHRYADSPAYRVAKINNLIRDLADEEGVHLLSADVFAANDGIAEWHDISLWHRSKQEIHPRVSHLYGDQVARILAAIRGRSRKCLVLDLDNTLWGGVIGDDGLAGITLGQGNAVGEAHLAVQRYALDLSRRGIILAVSSKNDEANALEAFEKHPEMILGRQDIACFNANWDDKPSNLRDIARKLNIGIDSLVFIDDNPFERNLVRAELPEVAVPELPEDPALYVECIAAAGYFEGLQITSEDKERGTQYRMNAARDLLRDSTTDMPTYLASLQMELRCGLFDEIAMARIVQLINKTNQFNLTTRRYTEAEVKTAIVSGGALHLQFRLLDRFGDNGIIGLVMGNMRSDGTLLIDTWLMSCRVLGRQVEAAMLNVVAKKAKLMGAGALVGVFRATAKNAMVKDLYKNFGFEHAGEAEGEVFWKLSLDSFRETDVFMNVSIEGLQ